MNLILRDLLGDWVVTRVMPNNLSGEFSNFQSTYFRNKAFRELPRA